MVDLKYYVDLYKTCIEIKWHSIIIIQIIKYGRKYSRKEERIRIVKKDTIFFIVSIEMFHFMVYLQKS
jgi:hypothetical protein